jgi:hypothetical protein
MEVTTEFDRTEISGLRCCLVSNLQKFFSVSHVVIYHNNAMNPFQTLRVASDRTKKNVDFGT